MVSYLEIKVAILFLYFSGKVAKTIELLTQSVTSRGS